MRKVPPGLARVDVPWITSRGGRPARYAPRENADLGRGTGDLSESGCHEQTHHPHRRRRRAGVGRDRRATCGRGTAASTGSCGPPRAPRRSGAARRAGPARRDRSRSSSPTSGCRGMTGIELLAQARTHAPTREAPAADRVRRHRRRDPGHQRHRPRPLPAQALGPARGAALPRRRRPARRLAARSTPTHGVDVRVVGHRWSERSHEIKTFLARNHVPYRWHDVERDDEGTPAARAGRRRRPTTCRWCWCPTPRRCGRPRPSTSPSALGLRTRRRAAALRRLHRRRRTGRAGRRRLRRLGGAAHRRRRARGARRAGRHRAPRSRTTSASPRA